MKPIILKISRSTTGLYWKIIQFETVIFYLYTYAHGTNKRTTDITDRQTNRNCETQALAHISLSLLFLHTFFLSSFSSSSVVSLSSSFRLLLGPFLHVLLSSASSSFFFICFSSSSSSSTSSGSHGVG